MATYDDVINSWTPEQWQKFGSMGGVVDKNNNLTIGATPESIAGLGGNSYATYMNQKAFGGLGADLTKGGLQDIGMGANILGAGYDLYSNLFGDKHDMFKTQMGALKQNMANIKEDRANHQTYIKNIGGGFNSAFGNGLAANAAARVG